MPLGWSLGRAIGATDCSWRDGFCCGVLRAWPKKAGRADSGDFEGFAFDELFWIGLASSVFAYVIGGRDFDLDKGTFL